MSLEACKGEIISILGASGSGKPTLLRCTNLLEVPSANRIAIGNEEIKLKRGARQDADHQLL